MWCEENPSHLSERRALARLFLLDQLLQKLVSKGLVRDPVTDLGGLLAVARRDGQDLPVDFIGPGGSSPVQLDVDRVT